MAKNYFNRYVWLIDTIQKHGYITFSDISDLWEVSSLNEEGTYLPERTFFNHREAIKDIFGIDIKFDKALGYYLACDDLDAEGIRSWLLTSLSVNNLISESSELRDRILFENIPSGRQFLSTAIDAMKESKVLEMTYQKFGSEPTTFEVAPYCVKIYKQRWYMVGLPEKKEGEQNRRFSLDDLRIYALDRVKCLQQTRKDFKMSKKFDAAEYFASYFGIVHDGRYAPTKVVLRVNDRQRNYFREVPLHHSQKEIETGPEWSIFEYFLAPTWDFERDLMQYTSQVEVLEPAELRDMMIEHAWMMLHLYKEA